jgi:hypothetical protein
MNKSDIMGRFLGFSKNKEYKEHWTWFDQRLSHSKTEFQTVQKWLNDNVEASLNQTGSTSINNSINDSSTTLISPSIQVTKPSVNNLAELGKCERQISFALRATSSSVNLMYNSFRLIINYTQKY